MSVSCDSLAALTERFSARPAATQVLVRFAEGICEAPTARHKSLQTSVYSRLVRAMASFAFTAEEAAYLTEFAGQINATPTVAVVRTPNTPNANGW